MSLQLRTYVLLTVLASTWIWNLPASATDQDLDGIPDEQWDNYEKLRNRFYEKLADGNTTSDDVMPILDNILRHFPSSVEFRLERGDQYLERKEYRKSITDYQKVLLVAPQHPGTHFKLAKVEALAGLNQQALADSDLTIAENPSCSPDVYFLKGYMLAKLKRVKDAQRALGEGSLLATNTNWDSSRSEYLNSALKLLNLKELPKPAAKAGAAQILIDEAKALAETPCPPNQADFLKFLKTTEWYRKSISISTNIYGKPNEHWSSIKIYVTPMHCDIEMEPNKMFAVVHRNEIEAVLGKPDSSGQVGYHTKNAIRYHLTQSEMGWTLPYSNPREPIDPTKEISKEVTIHWVSPQGKEIISRGRIEREKRKAVRASKADQMISLLKKLDKEVLDKPLTVEKIEKALNVQLYRDEESNPSSWSNRRPSNQVEEAGFDVWFCPEAIESVYQLRVSPGDELYRTSQAQFEEAFGRGTASDGGQTWVYDRPYGSISARFERTMAPGESFELVKRGVFPEKTGPEFLVTLSFWRKPDYETRSISEFQASRTWRYFLDRAIDCILKKQTAQANLLLQAAYNAIQQKSYADRVRVLPILKEIKNAYISLYKEQKDSARVAYLERVSCFEFQLHLMRQIGGIDKTFPTLDEYHENTWKLNLSETSCHVDKRGLPPANTDENPSLQKKFFKQFGAGERRVQEIPADLVDELYFGG